jgi:hypothetical protein
VRIAADRLERLIDAADLNQHSRLEVEPALVVVLDTIAVFPRRELSQPLARVQPIARVRHLDRVLARRIGDLKDFLGQQISALFSRARVHVGKVLAPFVRTPARHTRTDGATPETSRRFTHSESDRHPGRSLLSCKQPGKLDLQ